MNIDFNQIIIAVIGVLSALSGVSLSEYFKRKEREALFSEVIFQKKLKVYEELYKRLEDISNKAHELINNDSLTKQKRLDLWTDVVFDLARFLDTNDLYVNESIKLHSMTMIIGVEDIPDLSKSARKNRERDFYQDLAEAKGMIKEEVGIRRLEKFFTKINKPNLRSRWTEYAEKIKSEKK